MIGTTDDCPSCGRAVFSKGEKLLTFWSGINCRECGAISVVSGALYRFLQTILYFTSIVALFALVVKPSVETLAFVAFLLVLDALNKIYIGKLFAKVGGAGSWTLQSEGYFECPICRKKPFPILEKLFSSQIKVCRPCGAKIIVGGRTYHNIRRGLFTATALLVIPVFLLDDAAAWILLTMSIVSWVAWGFSAAGTKVFRNPGTECNCVSGGLWEIPGIVYN